MQNIVEWHGIVSDRQLMELALDSLLNRYLVIAFQNSVFGTEMLSKLNAVSFVIVFIYIYIYLLWNRTDMYKSAK